MDELVIRAKNERKEDQNSFSIVSVYVILKIKIRLCLSASEKLPFLFLLKPILR